MTVLEASVESDPTLSRTPSDPSLPAGTGDRTEVPVLEMVQPLGGFPERRRFALARLDETGMICDLQSVEDPDLRFVVVHPAPFFADYAPEIDDSVIAELGVQSADDVLALLVVTLGETLETSTANLLAPLLVNHRTRRAGQYLLGDPDLPMRAPLSPAS